MKKVLLTTLALALTASGFWPAGGVKVVQTPESISNLQTVYLIDGSVIISWEDWGSNNRPNVYCQKLNTTGVIHWDAEGIRVCLSDSTQRDHHMVTDGQDVWFVWQDERSDDGDIYAQKLSGSTGQRQWGDQGKGVCVKEGTQRLQTCTVLPSGSFIATWGDYSIDPRDVVAQWFDINGQKLWEPNGIYVTRSTGGGYKPIVLPSGEAILDVWLGVRTGDTVAAYFAQRVDTDGNFLWDTLGTLIEYISMNYDECNDGLGGAVVLFGNPGYLGVQRIDSLGQVVWDSGGVKVTEFAQNNSQSIPFAEQVTKGLITDRAGGCFVWRALPVTGYSWVQHIDSSGNLTWGIDGVTYWQRQTEDAPLVETELCSDGDGGIMAAFDNIGWKGMEEPYGVEFGVRVQRINSDGEVLFDPNGVIVREWPTDSLYVSLLTASSVPGGVIAVWDDNRHNPEYSLYAQIVDTTGKVGSGIEEEHSTYVSYPILTVDENLVSARITLRYLLPAENMGVLKLFDAAGKALQSQTLNQPEGVITLNIRNLPSGVYFVQLSTLTNKRTSRKVLVIH